MKEGLIPTSTHASIPRKGPRKDALKRTEVRQKEEVREVEKVDEEITRVLMNLGTPKTGLIKKRSQKVIAINATPSRRVKKN